jgi:sugar phosphate isomerase/epimerase
MRQNVVTLVTRNREKALDRRDFILAAAAAIAACARESEGPAPAPAAKAPPLGLQLYTVRDLMAKDVAATLKLVAGAGYQEVEFAGYFDHPAAELRGMLADSGLAAPSAHIPVDEFESDVNAVIEHAKQMGHGYVVVPWIDEGSRSLDDYHRHALNFNGWASACADAGLTFAYHNHDFEFVEDEGTTPYDVLLNETDPKLVKMELDLAWATKGGADPAALFEAWPGRFPMVHLKDLDKAGDEADIGAGGVAFDKILQHAGIAGIEHGFVERDNPHDPAAAIRRNHDAILPIWSRDLGRS